MSGKTLESGGTRKVSKHSRQQHFRVAQTFHLMQQAHFVVTSVEGWKRTLNVVDKAIVRISLVEPLQT